jgi:glutathione S-transferase
VLELHIANKNYSSWSLRPWVLMRELGIEFKERMHPFEPDGDWRDVRLLSPSGKVPFVLDSGNVVWDSLAIVEHLHERYNGVWPADPARRAYARSAAAEMHAGFQTLRSHCSMSCGVRIRLNGITPELRRDLVRLAVLWRDGLVRFGGPFLTGTLFTAVDAFFAPVAFRVQTYDLELPDMAMGYVARLLHVPAMREWYAAALAEPWREPGHDAECLTRGELIEDLRGSTTLGYAP